jgi:protein-S-isoprenylcysteine O-methyltransferase Ste14
VFTTTRKLSLVDWTIVALFSIHYFNRSFIYPFRTKTSGKRIPLSIVGLALFHNLANGFLIGYFVANLSTYTNDWFTSWQFITGLCLFIVGMIINMQSDNILIGLRKDSNDGYKIPYGGCFKYISSPNLVGEMLEWIGFAVLCWSLPTFCFAFFTFCNLFPRALANHRWYKRTFTEYPVNRKAVIPFIF